MALHLLHAGRLARKLADDAVTPSEQAAYFAATFIIWLVPGYLFFLPPAFGSGNLFFTRGLWYGQLALLVTVNLAGAFHCLRQSQYEPRRHFLVDLTCLSAPASIASIVIGWGIYYAVIGGNYALMSAMPDSPRLATETYWKLHDMLVYFVVVGQAAATYFIAGRYMRRASQLRMGAR